MECFGMGDMVSFSALQIKMGHVFEQFWNQVIQEYADSLIMSSDRIVVDNKQRQIDMCFVRDNTVYYLENVNFDSEKTPASNDKVRRITQELHEHHPNKKLIAGYFMPNVPTVPRKFITKYTNKGINIYGVQWMCDTLECTAFTPTEYFDFLKTVCGPLIKRKLNIV
jgi:hypothetical protein